MINQVPESISKIQAVPVSEAPIPTGWMTPEGKLFPCEPQGHRRTARHILSEHYNKYYDGGEEYEALYRLRFIHITYDCSCDMGHGWQAKRPNSRQINALWELAESDLTSSYERQCIIHFINTEVE